MRRRSPSSRTRRDAGLPAETRRAAFAGLVLLSAAPGCSKGCGRDKPYVPYAIGEGGTEAADAGVLSNLSEAADGGASFSEAAATPAPPNVSRWSLGGREFIAPSEYVLDAALVADVDSDGEPDGIALAHANREGGSYAVLSFHGAHGHFEPPERAVVPSDVALCPGVLPPRFALLGKRSAILELPADCTAGTNPRGRFLGVFAVGKGTRLRLGTSLLDPAGAPGLTVDADPSDKDGDGIDDVTLRITLEGGGAPFEPAPKMSALLRYFDRPAGLSRDPDEPDASLRALAQQAAVRAGKAKTAGDVPLRVRQIRALYGAMCVEGGAPRVVRMVGMGPVTCGASRALEEAGLAEVRARATLGDVLRAIAALDRAQRPPATKTPSRSTNPQDWIVQSAPVTASASQVRQIAAVPEADRGKAPAWGPLAFESSGKLLVETAAGVVRVDPAAGDEADATDVAPWKANVLSPDGGARWIEAYSPCDGVALHATFAPVGDATDGPKDVALPIAPPLAEACAAKRGEPARAFPVAWGASGLSAAVAGELVHFDPALTQASALVSLVQEPGNPGSPRSPDGKTLIVPTTLGLVVVGGTAGGGGGKARILRAKELDGAYGELAHCTVSDDGLRVACTRGAKALVGIWDAMPAP